MLILLVLFILYIVWVNSEGITYNSLKAYLKNYYGVSRIYNIMTVDKIKEMNERNEIDLINGKY